MSDTRIKKSQGTTSTEKLLSDLCDSTFLKLWSYPNPFKDDGHELCDLLVVFENSIFIFFDREKTFEITEEKDPQVLWNRWKRKAVEAQIQTAYGAERYLKSGRNVYIDNKMSTLLPFEFDREKAIYHKFVIAHGAAEACLSFSDENVTGSLAITYGEGSIPFPFFIDLQKDNPVNVLDSHTLPLIMSELDTINDFERFYKAKYQAIANFKSLSYCGEEDLLAHYFYNFNKEINSHCIGPQDGEFDFISIGEGEWKEFSESKTYQLTKEANEISYLWDEIIQRSSDFALKRESLGSNPLDGKSAIYEMAKEPRFVRRELSKGIASAIDSFPDKVSGFTRKLSMMPSFEKGKAYVFLQMCFPDSFKEDKNFREKRFGVLEIACGAAKINFAELNIVVGILIESPKHSADTSEDFIVMYCNDMTDDDLKYYKERGDEFNFFKTGKPVIRTAKQFINEGD